MWENLKEVFEQRQLMLTFAARDYKVRYAQTFIGYWWSLIQPIASVAVLFVVFQKLVKVPTEGVPYLPFALSGLILWNYFNYVITQSAASLINNQGMIRKIYFPKLTLPLSRAIVGLVEPVVGFVLLLGLLMYYGHLNLGVLFFLIALIGTAISALGIGLWTAALSIRYRDMQQILPFVLQFIFFLTPVAYSADLLSGIIPSQWGFVLYLNPMTGIIESFRAILFGGDFNLLILMSYAAGLVLFASGLALFQKMEMKIADIV